jgi:hypothetical protein
MNVQMIPEYVHMVSVKILWEVISVHVWMVRLKKLKVRFG